MTTDPRGYANAWDKIDHSGFRNANVVYCPPFKQATAPTFAALLRILDNWNVNYESVVIKTVGNTLTATQKNSNAN